MSREESRYLLEGLAHQFPALGLTAQDAICVYAGVRPVVAGGKADPSAESRDSAFWSEPGLIGVTGGKLTTFRVTARQVLAEAAKQVPELAPSSDQRVFGQAKQPQRDPLQALRDAARHEQVRHLDDLMMRRTRLGLLMPAGGEGVLGQVADICKTELGWDDARWHEEKTRYLEGWRQHHSTEGL